jgi:glycosyltransferase involved in cell wall biosynthesis
MKILIITDAWMPQVNGVVRTLTSTIAELQQMSHQIKVISPDQFNNVPCPTYPEIRLALPFGRKIFRIFKQFKPDAIHIATEGPLGFYSRILLSSKKIPYTTSFATKFPEYIYDRFRISPDITYRALRWFHSKSHCVMVATESVKKELSEKGFENIVLWGKGVDKKIFYPRGKDFLQEPRPILLYTGRVAVEKNIEAFLSVNMEGTKYVVGGGPALNQLKAAYPAARFVGAKHGEELARYYSAADVFVFPSLSDTFGLVMIEALSCGVPVAAYPVTGPKDVIGDSGVGVLDQDLGAAVRKALHIPPQKCVDFAKQFSWEQSTCAFLSNLRQI